MRVAGLGFRSVAPLASLEEALGAALAADDLPLDAVAALPQKAGSPVMLALAKKLGLPVWAVEVAGVHTPTQSARIVAGFGTGSVAEAAALAAAGPGARLVVGRRVSADGMATAAIAEGMGRQA
ncbi:MAG: cobalamin biosynthesis protein [Paracoccaceae bacterium]